MKKTSIILIAVAIVIVLVIFGFKSGERQEEQQLPQSYKDATYVLEGKAVTLSNGLSEIEAAPGSTSKIITRYFGNQVSHDFNGDGREDIAFLLTQESGGSGIFYYVVAALNTENGFVGSEALFLGDRIAPQTTEMSRNPSQKNVIIVNYAERLPGESFATRPSMGKSIWLLLNTKTMQFGEVVQDFEGEADPSRMTLGMKAWIWQTVLYNDGKEIRPRQQGKFTVTFSDGGRFSATTDCNSMGGNYVAGENTISFSSIVSTKMYCEGSQESDFAAVLEAAENYHFTSKGELIFDLKFDSGSAIFR